MAVIDALPETFRFSEALELMNERAFRKLLHDGHIDRVSRGLYRKSGSAGDDDLIEIATRSPRATLALHTALARHGLIDDIPSQIDIAIPRGAWAPTLHSPVQWHRFARETFDIGRDTLPLGDISIGIYTAPRSIIDAFRLHDGDVAVTALKEWLRAGGQPSELIRMARSFPAAQRGLQTALEVLL